MTHEEIPIALPLEELKAHAAAVAAELKAAGDTRPLPPSGGGSFHRALHPDLRYRFIEVRAALYQRGLFDPVLLRFDTASSPLAKTTEIGEQLAKVAASL